MSVVNFVAELFGLPTREMYDEVIADNLELQRTIKELQKSKQNKSVTPYIKVEGNIFKYFNKYVVKVVHHRKRYLKSFNTIDEAREYLTEVKKNGKD